MWTLWSCARTTRASIRVQGGFVFKGTPHEVAIQESVNTRRGVERCLRYAFELTAKRRGGKPWKGLKPEDITAARHPN
jgi:isocitrate/isopropylmalate dehydrogenase